jgi:hypothetical protein
VFRGFFSFRISSDHQLRVQLMAKRRRMPPRGSKSRSPSRNHRAQPRGRRFTRRMPRNFRCCLGLMCESPDKVWDRAAYHDRRALSRFRPEGTKSLPSFATVMPRIFSAGAKGGPAFRISGQILPKHRSFTGGNIWHTQQPRDCPRLFPCRHRRQRTHGLCAR